MFWRDRKCILFTWYYLNFLGPFLGDASGVSRNKNLRYPRCCKENFSSLNKTCRHHQTKFDFLYYTNKTTTEIKKSFHFFHERFTMSNY